MVVILCCDITELKAINDEFGHEIGDAVLGEVGKRLGEIAEQHGTVARIGADEFVVTQLVDDQNGADGLSLYGNNRRRRAIDDWHTRSAI